MCVSHCRYFLVDLEGPPSVVSTMMDHLGRDIDIIRRAFIKYPVSKTEECSGIVPVNYEDKLIPKKKWILKISCLKLLRDFFSPTFEYNFDK